MSTSDNSTSRTPAESDSSSTDASGEKDAVHTTADGKRIKGVEGEAPLPDDQPQREDEDLSALLQNRNASQKPN